MLTGCAPKVRPGRPFRTMYTWVAEEDPSADVEDSPRSGTGNTNPRALGVGLRIDHPQRRPLARVIQMQEDRIAIVDVERIEVVAAHGRKRPRKPRAPAPQIELDREVLTDASGRVVSSRADLPRHDRLQFVVWLIRAVEVDSPSRGGWDGGGAAVVAKNTSSLVSRTCLRLIEDETVGLPCPDPEIAVCRSWSVVSVVDGRVHNDAVPLSNANQDVRGVVRCDGDEVAADDLQPMVVDGEDEGRSEGRIDQPEEIALHLGPPRSVKG